MSKEDYLKELDIFKRRLDEAIKLGTYSTIAVLACEIAMMSSKLSVLHE